MITVESAWAKYPGYVIGLVPLVGIGRAYAGGILVAESDHCLRVRESEHREQLYFPREHVNPNLILESPHRTTCPFKGVASHASVHAGGSVFENAMWWYPDPMAEVAGLAGYVAFYLDRLEVTASVPFGDGDGDGDEATVRLPMWGTAAELAHLMDAEPDGAGGFTAPTFPEPRLGSFFPMAWHEERRNVIEGGQLLGAAIVAAAKARPDQQVSSAHMGFLKAASFDEPLHVALDARRLGSTLSAFDVRIEQAGALRATGLVMTDAGAGDLIRHTVAMPDVPPPSECPRHDFGVLGRETRVVDGAYAQTAPVGPPELFVWTRFTEAPAEAALHQALLAQASTHYSIGAALRHHEGVSEADAHLTVSMGPVNATIAFHDEVDVTQWLLTETRSIWAGRGSSQSQVRVFTADGRLVASKSVQAIIRAFERTPDQLGQGYSTVM